MTEKNSVRLTRKNVAITAISVVGSLSSTFAFAELPAAVSTAFTGISSTYTDMEALAWPIIGAIVSGFIVIKLFKKFANKAT